MTFDELLKKTTAKIRHAEEKPADHARSDVAQRWLSLLWKRVTNAQEQEICRHLRGKLQRLSLRAPLRKQIIRRLPRSEATPSTCEHYVVRKSVRCPLCS